MGGITGTKQFSLEMRTSIKYELHWVKAQTLGADTYHDEQHGTFGSLAAAQNAVRRWWDENHFKPPYIREIVDDKGAHWWDYGAHNCFYCFKEALHHR